MFNFKKKNFSKLDLPLILAVLGLVIIGLITLYSATLSLEGVNIRTQILSTILGFIAIVVLVLIDYDFLKKLAPYLYILGTFLMVLVNLFGTGAETWGSDNWLVIGPISFQPSEFMKLFLIISLAWMIERNYEGLNKPWKLIKVLAFAGLPILLILKEDFGTAFASAFIVIAMLFLAGISWAYIILALVLLIVSLPFLYQQLDDYQKDRILNFLNPARDIADTGLQALQGRIAIGSGMVLGRGLFQGVQTQNNFIPEKHTDFIFPVLAEEAGLVGVIIVLALYCLVLYRILAISQKAKDPYGRMICAGVFSLLFIHIFVNIGMTLGVLPITGIPLPFFSYGGTSQLVNLMSIGLVLHVGVERSELEFSALN